MKIKLKKLKLTNFKGIRNLDIDFTDKTDIMGKNGSGKTTIFDAFLFLLFGKNSQDKKDFEIKTLDQDNNPIHKIDHEVEAVLTVDGSETTLKRCFREKWTKPKGQPEAIFSGHETLFWWNDVPLNQGEYKTKVEEICEESRFKLLTNPSAFNLLNWNNQREILFDIAGEVTNDDVLSGMLLLNGEVDLQKLSDVLSSGKKLDEFKKELSAKKKKLSDELKEIPTRIDEAHRSMPDPVDERSIKSLIKGMQKEIDELDSHIADKAEANEAVLKIRQNKQDEIYRLLNKVSELKFADSQANQKRQQEASGIYNLIQRDVEAEESKLSEVKNTITHNSNQIIEATNEIAKLKKEWEEVNSEQLKFDENEFHCPACKRAFETSDIEAKKEELRANFNTDKQRKISIISEKGNKAKAFKDSLIEQNEKLEIQATKLKASLSELTEKANKEKEQSGKIEILTNPEIAEIEQKVDQIKTELNNELPIKSNDLLEKKKTIQERISGFEKELTVNEQIKRTEQRISELEEQAKKLGQEVSDLEREEFTIKEFTKRKIEMVEGRINEKFNMVSFKMYRQLINGEDEECCECLINGVPYSDANNASKTNAGIDIINTLSNHYEVYAPIIIDNAESINNIIPSESQIVRLVVTEDEVLKVVTKELETVTV